MVKNCDDLASMTDPNFDSTVRKKSGEPEKLSLGLNSLATYGREYPVILATAEGDNLNSLATAKNRRRLPPTCN